MERTALIYYSLDGNTHFIAQKMSKQLGCPVIRLKLQKEFSTTNKFLKFFWAGQSSVFRTKPPLANKAIDLKAYDTLVIASPVWAGSVSSPVRSFPEQLCHRGKRCLPGGKQWGRATREVPFGHEKITAKEHRSPGNRLCFAY